jgi:hypothetical protein
MIRISTSGHMQLAHSGVMRLYIDVLIADS